MYIGTSCGGGKRGSQGLEEEERTKKGDKTDLRQNIFATIDNLKTLYHM